MIFAAPSGQTISKLSSYAVLTVLAYHAAAARQSQPDNQATEQDHQDMMNRLGIKALRPGPSGNEKDPNHANYDEAKASPYGDLPDALTL